MLSVYHSNQLERLGDLLAKRIAERPGDALEPVTVVVAHPGMGRWLQLHLAHRLGVAANLHYPLPARFAWDVLRRAFPQLPEASLYERPMMLWRLYALLDSAAETDPLVAAALAPYLGRESGSELKRYQLAQRLSAVFERYLTYRRDWLLEWERGELPSDPEHAWQARLWQALAASGEDHWAGLIAQLERDPTPLRKAALPAELYAFGLSALTPSYLRLLELIADVTDVHLFFPNPCLHWWGEILPEKALARLSTLREHHALPDGAYHEVGHPLLASLGKLGQQFLRELYASERLQDDEGENFVDPCPPDIEPSLLQRLQRDILLLHTPTAATLAASDPEPSVQVHCCHSRLREMQVLHDRLLALLDEQPALSPRDVLVMIPDIGSYAPYIEAVFNAPLGGDADMRRRYIPYTISDRCQRELHPVLAAFGDLLELPSSRWGASEILDLLRVPAVSRRFGLDEQEHERLRAWVSDCGVRWGLDEDFRARRGAGRFRQNSWAFGLDRMLLGYAFDAERTLVEGILPYPHSEGSAAESIGKLAGFIEQLRRLDACLAEPKPASHWRDALSAHLDALFAAEDADEAQALQCVRTALEALATDCARAGCTGALPWSVVRYFLAERLEQSSTAQPLLQRGVTFCALMPMRNLPFPVVWLAGMNHDDFPRQDAPAEFDLLGRSCSARDEDRYLFLEALLAARERLLLSYVGRSVRDNTPREPAVLVSELLDCLQRHYGLSREALVIEHPLQAFSAANFRRGDPRRFSYAGEWLTLTDASPRPFLDAALPAPGPEAHALDLDDLLRFVEHPAAFVLRRRLQVDPRPLEEVVPDEEPWQLDGLHAFLLRQGLVREGLESGAIPSAPPADLIAAGELPAGDSFAALHYAPQAERARALRATLMAERDDWSRPDPLELREQRFSLQDGTELRFSGWLREVYPDARREWRAGKLRAKHRLRLWVQHLALQLYDEERGHAPRPSLLFAYDQRETPIRLTLRPVGDAHARLGSLLEWYWQALHGRADALLFFPEAGLAYAAAKRKDADEATCLAKALAAWQQESADPSFALCCRDLDAPLGGAFQSLARQVYDPLLAAEEAD